MYSVLRASRNYDGSTVYAIADWDDSSVDYLTSEEVKKCLQMGFKIEGTALKGDKLMLSSSVPRDSGSDKIVPIAVKGMDKLSMLVSYSYVGTKNHLMVIFHVDGEPLYSEGTYRNRAISTSVDRNLVVLFYDRHLKKTVNKHAFIDYISVSGVELLNTTSKKPLFKLSLSSMDKHFYGEDREEYFYTDCILEYRPNMKKFFFVGGSLWHTSDCYGCVVVDNERKELRLEGLDRVIYSWV